MTNVHIVNHTHWDREWYFTSMDALTLSDQLFTDVITELERNREASFVLDGQLSILDDYIGLYPEKIDRVKDLILRKQLFIGPWFTQTDAFFTSGEAILRNAMIGIFESKKYGEYMPIGYLPDTFGFNAQIPVILNEAGLDNIILWRGVSLGKHVKSPYFKWQSLGGGNTLHALNFPQGYGTGMLLEPTLEYVEGRLDKAVDFIKEFSDLEQIIIPSGNDQLGIIADFKEKVAAINDLGKYTYEVSTYQRFLEHIKGQELETYQGEFREPVLARVHKTIGSVRADLKQTIFQLEAKLLHQTEPLLVIGANLGITLSNRLLLTAWKKLLECQAHDSLAGCVSDAVAEDIHHRLKEANEICDSIENIVLKRISEALDLSAQEILVVNSSPVEFSGQKTIKLLATTKEIEIADCESLVLSADYVDSRENVLEETPAGNRFITEPGYYILTVLVTCQLPGLGYKVLKVKEVKAAQNQLRATAEQQITMGESQLSFENGQVTYRDSQQVLTNFISLVDEGNAGDTYDFSPLENDAEINLTFASCVTEEAAGLKRMTLKGTTTLPLTLAERAAKKATTDFSYELRLELTVSGELQGQIKFVNTVLNHRLRLKISLNQGIKRGLSGIPYGFISKENQDISQWEGSFAEMPVNIEPFEKTVTVYTETTACSVFTHDSKEYEYQGNQLLITLLATTDSLGKPDLIYRPGRASGDTTKKGHIMMATPLAQLKDKAMTYNFSLQLRTADLSEAELATWRSDKEQPSISYQRQSINYFVYRIDNKIQKRIDPLVLNDREFSLLSLPKAADLLVSSVHQSYYQAGFVIRFENPTKTERNLNLTGLFPKQQLTRINAIEEVQEFSTMIPAYGVASFLVTEK
ncbi:glycoside hydrolase family 38 C-terminal domain-containing protein [Vagococcus salmoninarum]|uniref:glycoside hydrolase family 38 N-terminal domain-containing protein n=1 Tax=Vagococcus salmoninarum TaxID=2739 RepID=UPI0028D361CD|nr:glycoside hydrolase family 38 C-terminal domain-containing protein [Vagococcus salmoninarum]